MFNRQSKETMGGDLMMHFATWLLNKFSQTATSDLKMRHRNFATDAMDSGPEGSKLQQAEASTLWNAKQPTPKPLAAGHYFDLEPPPEHPIILLAVLILELMGTYMFYARGVKKRLYTEFQIYCSALSQQTLLQIQKSLSSIVKLQIPLAFILVAALISPASAIEDEIALQGYHDTTATQPDAGPQFPLSLIGTYVLFVVGLVITATTNFSGPLMGISSVLWFMMRNDAAIKPSISWAVFGVWGAMVLTYLSLQTRRVAFAKLYVLLALASAAVCLCIIGLVQKSSIQGGLVTAIPPCTSFAAYAVAFCFPSRRPSPEQNSLV